MAFDVGEGRRVGACVRGSGVRRCVGARGSVRRRCALCSGGGESKEMRKKMNAERGERLPPPPYLLTAGGDRARGIYCARSP